MFKRQTLCQEQPKIIFNVGALKAFWFGCPANLRSTAYNLSAQITFMSIFDQLPRLSAYDPGATGEGGLDPLGLSAIADRIADVLAPGVRARMSQPRFVTVSAVGAIAYQTLLDVTADLGKTTVDIAFEWLVVEAMVRHPNEGRTEGLPGNQKAARALATGQRLSRGTYLNGPRVFGFTGVYRPFSRDVGVLTTDDRPGLNSPKLVSAWERDLKLEGYLDGDLGKPGGQLRKEIADACLRSLEQGSCAAKENGKLLRTLSDCLAPREAKATERRMLRELIRTGDHEIRNEITAMLVASPPVGGVTQRDLAMHLLKGANPSTGRALQAAIDYEDAATALDYAFRRFLAYAVQHSGSVVNKSQAQQTPGLEELAPRIGDLVERAKTSVDELGDGDLSNATERAFRLFSGRFSRGEFLDLLLERHEEVQANKKKLSWVDQIEGDWTVRVPYRNQTGDLDVANWTHPMRLLTLANFLTETNS